MIFLKSHEILYETVLIFKVEYYKSVKHQLCIFLKSGRPSYFFLPTTYSDFIRRYEMQWA